MQLHDLRSPEGSRRTRTRAGRGIAAGRGKTSGRGQKGQGARSSWSLPRAFEGGQMPLTQRVPKLRGFHNHFRITYAVVNCGKLLRFESGSIVDPARLAVAGLIPSPNSRVKLLAAGPSPAGLTVRVHRASRAATARIEASGGTVELIEAPTPEAEPAADTQLATSAAPSKGPGATSARRSRPTAGGGPAAAAATPAPPGAIDGLGPDDAAEPEPDDPRP